MKNENVIDVLIQNIQADQELFNTTDKQIETLKEEKREITNRLKSYRTDITVLLKYADAKHKEQIEALGLDLADSPSSSMNPVATVVLEIIMKAKENSMTNGALYDAYVKTLKNAEEAVNYTEFNIKCRSLFNTQRLLRSKGKDTANSREDIVSLNGRVLSKENMEVKKDTPDIKMGIIESNTKVLANEKKKEDAKG